MDKKEIVPVIIGGVVTGFTIGLGYILAQRLFGKLAAKVDAKQPSTEPERVQTATKPMVVQNSNAYGHYNGEPQRRSELYPIDFTTGQRKW